MKGVAWVKVDGKWGLIDATGNFIIEPKFEDVRYYSEGVAWIKVDGKWGLIDKQGKFLIQPKIDWPYGGFENGICRVEIDGEEKYIDKTGNFLDSLNNEDTVDDTISDEDWVRSVLGCDDDDVDEFSEGLVPIEVNEKWGYVNPTGDMVIAPNFDRADSFEDGLAIIKMGQKFGMIDKDGNYIVEPKEITNCSTRFENGYLRVKTYDGWGVINKSGEWVIKPQFDYIVKGLSEGKMRFQNNEQFGFVDLLAGSVIPPLFNFVWDFNNGIARVRVTELQRKLFEVWKKQSSEL